MALSFRETLKPFHCIFKPPQLCLLYCSSMMIPGAAYKMAS